MHSPRDTFDKAISNEKIQRFVTVATPPLLSVLFCLVSKEDIDFIHYNTSVLTRPVFYFCAAVLIICTFLNYKISDKNTDILNRTRELESKLENCNKNLLRTQNENSSLRSIHAGLSTLCAKYAESANAIIHQIIDEGEVRISKDSFKQACTFACEQVRNCLINRFGSNSDYEVSYVQRDETALGKTVVKTVGKDAHRITNYAKERVAVGKCHYDCSLIARGSVNTVVLDNEKAIEMNFRGSRDSIAKYKQYMAVPVVCCAREGQKVIGLLQVAITKSPLPLGHEELESLANDLLLPYCNMLLLINKLIKGLLAVPDDNK